MGKEKWGGHRAFLTSNRAKVSSAKITRQQETTNKTQQTQQRKDQRRPAASKPAAIRIFVITKRTKRTTATDNPNSNSQQHSLRPRNPASKEKWEHVYCCCFHSNSARLWGTVCCV
ncbi:unnamed protein product [Polarella glacialis]|uniref:Uncharacterized protein n=1 Tax=Polarella glacialis TaxID=89957 RepID=A0A813GUB8_POLGL|nr:unnamed protein product [Polarella glacialis]